MRIFSWNKKKKRKKINNNICSICLDKCNTIFCEQFFFVTIESFKVRFDKSKNSLSIVLYKSLQSKKCFSDCQLPSNIDIKDFDISSFWYLYGSTSLKIRMK